MKLALALAGGLLFVSTIGFADSASTVLPKDLAGDRQIEEAGNTSVYLMGDHAALGIVAARTNVSSISKCTAGGDAMSRRDLLLASNPMTGAQGAC